MNSRSMTSILDIMPSIIIGLLLLLEGYHFYDVLDENFET